MYARFASENQAGAAAREGRSSGPVQVPPEENAQESRPTPVRQPEEVQHQSQYQQHIQYQERDSITRGPTDTPLPETISSRLSPGRIVEKLARKLSKQNLRLSRSKHGQRQTQQPPTPGFPSSAAAKITVRPPELRRFHGWAAREALGQPQHQALASPSGENSTPSTPWLPLPTLDVGEPIEVDEAYMEQPDDDSRINDAHVEKPDDRRLLDARRPRWQTNSQLRASSSTRPTDPRLASMIATGTQCNVRRESRLAPTPSPSPLPSPSTATGVTVAAHPPYIEPDPDCAMPTPEIDPDDNDADARWSSVMSGGLLSLAEEGGSMRYSIGPGGIRKYTVNGVALRYRLSADAALRCPNVVRNRPRMRRRTKTRHGSTTSSAVTSPAMSAAPSPPPLPL
ncbi:hypothetical protein C8A00DRAFT_38904 [Chaetomidium leptoderma]|uniref:Uncharacterized protein n=1 Tax=Chaetomidium leptoderma TaxID=669021 RepID=A0AAN6VCG4_9PEZI|nr:hypothetical protein C8A00DRAFT_38904 [Chaetomidium leptoderma]